MTLKRWIQRPLHLIWMSGILNGCVSVKPPQDSQLDFLSMNYAQRRVALQRIKAWHITGATSGIHDGKGHSAHFNWVQQANGRYRIQLAGALNVGSTIIQGGPGGVSVRTAKGDTYRGSSPAALLRQIGSWPLPVTQLAYWVRGIAAPGYHGLLTTDSHGHLTRLQQGGWTIALAKYISVGSVDLPRWLVMTRPGYKLKVLIRHWSLTR